MSQDVGSIEWHLHVQFIAGDFLKVEIFSSALGCGPLKLGAWHCFGNHRNDEKVAAAASSLVFASLISTTPSPQPFPLVHFFCHILKSEGQ
jgi:hypothetical protein